MTIRRRLSLVAAAAVAIAVALASIAVYLAVQANLRGEVDSALRERAQQIQVVSRFRGPLRQPPKLAAGRPPQARFGGAAGVVQLITPSGKVRATPPDNQIRIPPSAAARAVASGESDATLLTDQTVAGDHLRVLTAPLQGGGAVQVARPLDEVDSVLHKLVLILAAITAGGIGLAAFLGAVVSRASLAPVRRFTAETESVSQGPDLTRRLPVERDDELGRLARSYNSTLAALERSADAQRQMVSDASHELRTPLTTLKTNLELLLRSDSKLSGRDRAELEGDMVEQIDDLTLLVNDVVELARRGEPEQLLDDVALDEVVGDAIERAERHAPGIRFEAELEPCTVRGVPGRLGRATYNLLDNAVKWSPAGGVVEVRLSAGVLSVRDHGPGIKPEDLPLIFDRFYRAADARSRPGSGLGLAIVRQTADAHGARVEAANAAGGGAVLRLRFPEQPGVLT
jgi:two-component system sensor histidine kinase MprB